MKRLEKEPELDEELWEDIKASRKRAPRSGVPLKQLSKRKPGRPRLSEDSMRSFTCYLPDVDLVRAAKLAKISLSNQSAVIRHAIHLGLELLEKRRRKS